MAWTVNDEPAVVFPALGELIRQALPVLVLLGLVRLSQDKLVGVMILVSGALTFLTIFFTRKGSVSLPQANKQIEIAKASDVTTPTQDIIDAAAKGD